MSELIAHFLGSGFFSIVGFTLWHMSVNAYQMIPTQIRQDPESITTSFHIANAGILIGGAWFVIWTVAFLLPFLTVIAVILADVLARARGFIAQPRDKTL